MGEAIITRRGGSGGGESLYTGLSYKSESFSLNTASVFPAGGTPGSDEYTWSCSTSGDLVAAAIVPNTVGGIDNNPLGALFDGNWTLYGCALWLVDEPVNFSTSKLDCSMWYDKDQNKIFIKYVNKTSSSVSGFICTPSSITTYYK